MSIFITLSWILGEDSGLDHTDEVVQCNFWM